MCGSMVDIQSPTAEIRRGNIKRRKIEETTGWKYNVRICYAWAAITRRNSARELSIGDKACLMGSLFRKAFRRGFCCQTFSSWYRLEIKQETHQEMRYPTQTFSTMTSSTTYTHCAPEASEFGEMQNKGLDYAVQGHSRSPILIPIESSYATAY